MVGGSMAGLLAGRVLAEHFLRVTLIERDSFPACSEGRRGVPQGRHAHALLARGECILARLFPDLVPALLAGGATSVDIAADTRWHHFGHWKVRFPSGVLTCLQSRAFLEWHIRQRLAAIPGVVLRDRCHVTRLGAGSGGRRVTGVHLVGRGSSTEEYLPADLVVDASGRGSQTPRWLEALGYGRPRETAVRVNVGYASRVYRRPPQGSGAGRDWKALLLYPHAPQGRRLGIIFPIEGDRWIVTLGGWLEDYPPGDEAGFLDFARSLPAPDLYEAIRGAEPDGPIALQKFASSRRRHYEDMPVFPEGFVVMGDALCSFNPIYGQGMTTSALDAAALDACLGQQGGRGSLDGLGPCFHRLAARINRVPWLLATGEDFRYPGTEGHRPLWTRPLNWYVGRIHHLAAEDQEVLLRFLQVMHMIRPPTVLFDPRTVMRVITTSLVEEGRRRERLWRQLARRLAE